ncbi:uncharacterized protein LOC133806270 [Humulus lupulus]|uniref:uncharacterized protein LOC133806270 n=1 Tax=Humulus lupulus TaxID=3486 RepID=UPI002B4071B0|nr:uncharacterized protein LOC133806270 [Humulus lupulus]
MPYQGPLPNDSQNFGDGGDYDEGYYEEDNGEYEDHEVENPIDLDEKDMDPKQEDPEAFIAAQGLETNPSAVPPLGMRPLAPPIRTGVPNDASPIPPPGPSLHPGASPSNPAHEKGKAKMANPVGKTNPQKKAHPVTRTEANQGKFPSKERMNPVPGQDHPNDRQGKCSQGNKPRNFPRQDNGSDAFIPAPPRTRITEGTNAEKSQKQSVRETILPK